jgi:hypothetical protein
VDNAVAACLGAAICLLAAQPTFAKVDANPNPAVADVSPAFALPGVDKSRSGLAQALLEADLTPEERATVAIFDRNTPSVVNIANLAAYSRKCAPIHVLISLHLCGCTFLHYNASLCSIRGITDVLCCTAFGS